MDPARGRELARDLAIFAGWTPVELDRFLAASEVVEKAMGEAVVRAGEAVDGLYLILSGRVAVVIPEDGGERILGYLHRGEPIGEVALLSGEVSMATARAMGDAIFLRIPREVFPDLAREIPAFLFALSRITTTRLRRVQTGAATPAAARVVSVYSAEHRTGRSLFAFNLAASLARETGKSTLLLEVTLEGRSIWRFLRPGSGPPRLVSLGEIEVRGEEGRLNPVRHDAGFDVASVAHEEGTSEGGRAVSPLLAALSRKYHFLVLDLPPGMDEVVYRFLSQSDRVFLLTGTEPLALDRTRALFLKLPAPDRARIVVTPLPRTARDRQADFEARLSHPVYFSLPETKGLEEETEGSGVPHVVSHPEGHYARTIRHIARELGEVLVGLVLGSGAARGLSHIGVLSVLEEEKILVDVVAGTSIGAFIGGGWASGIPSEKMLAISRAIATKGRFFRLTDLAFPPSPALIRPGRTEEVLRRVFGEKTFGDTLVPLKIVAADLETSESVLFERGPIWRAVRASISIPGIFPPYEYEGRTLVDGAVVNPLPVSVMKRLGVRKIIAVNAIPSSEFVRLHATRAEARTDAAESAGIFRAIWRGVAARLFDIGKGELPGIMDVIVRSNQYLAGEVAEISCREASVVIRPWVPNLSWLDFDQPDLFVEAGRAATRAALPALRNMVTVVPTT